MTYTRTCATYGAAGGVPFKAWKRDSTKNCNYLAGTTSYSVVVNQLTWNQTGGQAVGGGAAAQRSRSSAWYA